VNETNTVKELFVTALVLVDLYVARYDILLTSTVHC